MQLPSPAAGICRWPGPAGRVPGLHGPDRRKRSGEPGRRPGAAFPAAGYAGGREDPAGDVSVGFLVGDLGCVAARRIIRIKIIYTVMRSLGTGPTAGPDPVLWRIAPILLGLCATTPDPGPEPQPLRARPGKPTYLPTLPSPARSSALADSAAGAAVAAARRRSSGATRDVEYRNWRQYARRGATRRKLDLFRNAYIAGQTFSTSLILVSLSDKSDMGARGTRSEHAARARSTRHALGARGTR